MLYLFALFVFWMTLRRLKPARILARIHRLSHCAERTVPQDRHYDPSVAPGAGGLLVGLW
jgi:hypothetical protein